jgi:type IV pilus assembly protein PilN
MIRINLLPSRDAPRRQAAVVQLVVIVVLTVIFGGVLFVFDSLRRGEIRAQMRANGIVEDRIRRIQTQIQDHDQIRSQIEEIEAKQAVIDQLQTGRTGPVMVMTELARMMSRNGAPTIDHDRYMDLVRKSPGQAYDPNWDGRRLWLSSFSEQEREAELNGSALSHEDVAELLRRLTLSNYFSQVILVQTRAAQTNRNSNGGSDGTGLVNFQIRCRLRYSGTPPEAENAAAEA